MGLLERARPRNKHHFSNVHHQKGATNFQSSSNSGQFSFGVGQQNSANNGNANFNTRQQSQQQQQPQWPQSVPAPSITSFPAALVVPVNGAYVVPQNGMQNVYPIPVGSTSIDDSSYEDDDDEDNGPKNVGTFGLSFGFKGGDSSSDNSTTTSKPSLDWGKLMEGILGGTAEVVKASGQKEMMTNMQRMYILKYLMEN